MKASLPLLPTSVVGSHAKMGWWYLVRQEAESGRMGPRDLAEALDTAVDIAILDQERAGVDVISDGEMRRLGSFYRTYLRRIEGIRMEPAEKLWINPDCGFNPTPRWVALPKLKAMVEGTKIVRRELGQED